MLQSNNLYIKNQNTQSYILLSTADKVKSQAGSVFTVNLEKQHDTERTNKSILAD